MIDIKALRDDPERFKNGVRLKRADVNIDELLASGAVVDGSAQ